VAEPTDAFHRVGDAIEPSGYRLRLPGPTPVPERVRRALAEQVLNHRGPEFREILSEVESSVKKVLRTESDVALFASSGTGGMEASLANTLDPGDRVLVLVNGQWGERFAAISRTLGAKVDTVEVPWGEQVDPQAVADKLALRTYRAVLVTHNESSTGVVTDLAPLGALTRDLPTLLVVDAISSLGAIDVRQDAWNLDIVIAASQKALMCPPGLSLLSVSPKAWEVVERGRRNPCFYWDLVKARKSLREGQTPYTTPVSLVFALRESLRMIHEEGLSRVLARHRRLAAALRAGTDALGLRPFPSGAFSDSVTAVYVPDGLDASTLVGHLHRRYRTVIAGSRNRLSSRVVRIGTMGYFDAAEILSDLLYMGKSLRDLGYPVRAGAGVAAATDALTNLGDA
jgi:aspartate aminotransferase-like enzyme